MQTPLSLDLWSGDALKDGPRLVLTLGSESRDLTSEEALTVAQKLVELATKMVAEENRARIAGFISELGSS